MLFLENGHVSALRTTSVGEGELGCMALSSVNGKEPLRLPLGEGPPIPRGKELKTTSPINAIARANARRRLLEATRSVGRMRAALCRGIWVTGESELRCSSCSTWYRFGKERTERRYRISEWVNGPKTYCLGTVTRVHLQPQMHRAMRRREVLVPAAEAVVPDARARRARLGRLKAPVFLRGD